MNTEKYLNLTESEKQSKEYNHDLDILFSKRKSELFKRFFLPSTEKSRELADKYLVLDNTIEAYDGSFRPTGLTAFGIKDTLLPMDQYALEVELSKEFRSARQSIMDARKDAINNAFEAKDAEELKFLLENGGAQDIREDLYNIMKGLIPKATISAILDSELHEAIMKHGDSQQTYEYMLDKLGYKEELMNGDEYHDNEEPDWLILGRDFKILVDEEYSVNVSIEFHDNPKGYFIGHICTDVSGDYPDEILNQIKMSLTSNIDEIEKVWESKDIIRSEVSVSLGIDDELLVSKTRDRNKRKREDNKCTSNYSQPNEAPF